MADNEQQFQEKTENATPKRLEEARKRGQIPRSRELNMAAVMIVASAVFFAIKPQLGGHMMALLQTGLTIPPEALHDTDSMTSRFRDMVLSTLLVFTPLLGALMLAAVLGAVSVGGWAFSAKPMEPKLSKVNPLKGLKRVFGVKGLVEVVKALAKAGLIGGIGYGYLVFSGDSILQLSVQPLRTTMAEAGQLVATMLLLCSLSLLLISLIDVPFQLWNHHKELKMTRKEVQDEMKESEGRPEVRSRVRALQQELASQRMLEEVPKADVIVTNPTHFAIALRYREGDVGAPVVLAKGMDHMAARIREIGDEHRIARFEAPLLARALYWTTDIGAEIPSQLYLAVAQVLTYVFRLRAAAESQAPWPDRPVVKVDEQLALAPKQRNKPVAD
jgi:flagellar biosynthetic protein FlhB